MATSSIRLEKWKRRIPKMYDATKSKGKRVFLGSVLVQMIAHETPPTEAQEAILNAWYQHYLSKNQVLVEAAKGLIS